MKKRISKLERKVQSEIIRCLGVDIDFEKQKLKDYISQQYNLEGSSDLKQINHKLQIRKIALISSCFVLLSSMIVGGTIWYINKAKESNYELQKRLAPSEEFIQKLDLYYSSYENLYNYICKMQSKVYIYKGILLNGCDGITFYFISIKDNYAEVKTSLTEQIDVLDNVNYNYKLIEIPSTLQSFDLTISFYDNSDNLLESHSNIVYL